MPLLKDHSTNQKVVDFMITNYFSTSTVTMSSDKYLKRAVHDGIIYPALIAAGILEVEQDPKQLEYAMFISSGGELYTDGALSGSFEKEETPEVVPTTPTPIPTAAPPATPESKEEESESPMVTLSIEKSKKDLEAHKDSLTSIINIINNANGIPRARFVPFKTPADQDNIDWVEVYSKISVTKGFIKIDHPLTLNFNALKNVDKYINEKFVNDLFLYESKHLESLAIPVKCMPADILDLMYRLPVIMDETLLAAKTSTKNSQLGVALVDPFADMFASML